MGKPASGRFLEPRYKIMLEEIIKIHNSGKASLEEAERYFNREFNLSANAKKLTGGRVNSVYKINHNGQDKVVKLAVGKYRVIELKREAEVLNFLLHQGRCCLVPNIRDFKILDSFAYLIEDYIDGKPVKDRLKANESIEERAKVWEKVGQALSEIHKLCQSEDKNYNWLESQLELARMNMKNNLLDPDEFEEETPERMLEWLRMDKPKRNHVCLLHGDYRIKNIIVDNLNNYNVIDWGFVDIGDPYYDLAIIDYYFNDDLDRDSFYRGYGDRTYDEELIEYYDKLSKFINI